MYLLCRNCSAIMLNHGAATILNDLVREIWGEDKTTLDRGAEGRWHQKIEGGSVLPSHDFVTCLISKHFLERNTHGTMYYIHEPSLKSLL